MRVKNAYMLWSMQVKVERTGRDPCVNQIIITVNSSTLPIQPGELKKELGPFIPARLPRKSMRERRWHSGRGCVCLALTTRFLRLHRGDLRGGGSFV